MKHKGTLLKQHLLWPDGQPSRDVTAFSAINFSVLSRGYVGGEGGGGGGLNRTFMVVCYQCKIIAWNGDLQGNIILKIYRKIPIISPGLKFVPKAFLLRLFWGELICGGAYKLLSEGILHFKMAWA